MGLGDTIKPVTGPGKRVTFSKQSHLAIKMDLKQLTLSFSYVVGESLVLLRFKLRRLDMITKDESPSSVTGVSQRFKDSKLWSCSATM